MTEGIVVINAGPLVALSMVNRLDLLEALYGRVLVPDAVIREVVGAGVGRVGAREVADAAFLDRTVVDPPPDPLLMSELGPGEAEVIALAHRRRASIVILDERRARRIAEHAYQLKVKGTAGVLVAAKRKGIVPFVRPLLEGMVHQGYFLSTRLVDKACEEVGEG
jgi:predicted nucleic acid-binding protein